MAHYLSAKSFASLCDGAKRIKDDHYIARCPAHDDSSPSLNIQEAKDKLHKINTFTSPDTKIPNHPKPNGDATNQNPKKAKVQVSKLR